MEHKVIAMALGYKEDTWNWVGSAEIEGLAFFELSADQQTLAKKLGFDEELWDCFHPHYERYNWDYLEERGLSVHFVTLGWTQARWDASDSESVPTIWSQWGWCDLDDEHKDAARELCYSKLTWNELPLQCSSEELDFQCLPEEWDLQVGVAEASG